MPVLLDAVRQGVGLLGLVISLFIDGMIISESIGGGLHRLNLERVIRPVSIFFVVLLVLRVLIWTI